jgi:hopanoid biosynthesis associated RND transporter like protein HpnN
VGDFCYLHPVLTLALGLALMAASLLYTVGYLKFDTDRNNLLNADEPIQRIFRKFRVEFPYPDDMVVMVEGGTPARREAFVDELAERLRREPDVFDYVFPRVELGPLSSRALYLMPLEDLKHLVAELREARPILAALSSGQGMGALMEEFARQAPAGETSRLVRVLPFLNQVLAELLDSLRTRGRGRYSSPWTRLLFAPEGGQAPPELSALDETAVYHTFGQGRIHLLLVKPARLEESFSPSEKAVRRLRQILVEVRRNYPDLLVGLTGEPVLETDEMMSSQSDAVRSSVWSLLLVTLLFAFAFREMLRPLMAIFSLVVGIGWTMGFTTLTVGHLNVLTVTFVSILVGLGVDFGVHYVYRYEEERGKGRPPREALGVVLRGTGVENFTGAVSTAIAFYAICFTRFRGVVELGWIAGTGVLLSFVAMTTMLPALLSLHERKERPVQARSQGVPWLAWLEERWLGHAGWVLGAGALFTLWCALQIPRVYFDYNLLNLQSQSLESVRSELHLIRSSERSVLFAVAVAADSRQAEELTRRFQALPTVSTVESVAPLVPSDVEKKTPYVREVQKIMAGVEVPRAPRASGARSLMSMAGGFLELDRLFREAYPELMRHPDPAVRRQAQRFRDTLNQLFSTLETMGPGPIEDGLNAFQKHFFADLASIVKFLKAQKAEPPGSVMELPENLRVRGVGETGKILLRIYPKDNVWEREALRQFVAQVRSVDPEAIGSPVMMYYYVEELRRAYDLSGYYAFAAICLLLLVHFRSLKTTALALLPKVLGVVWMLGIMVAFNVPFNPANFMGIPLILGIGLVFGVHVVHRFLEESHVSLFGHSTGPAIALCALTTMAGFGTLMLGEHYGIYTLGFVMTVGVGANLITSVVVLPALLKVLPKKTATGP